MEPDFDKLASKKIRQAELRPISWNKERVWQNVMSETKQNRQNYYVHYSAAAAVLLLLLFGLHQFQNNIQAQLTDVNKKPKQQNSESQKKSVAPETSENNIADKIDLPVAKIAPIAKIKQHMSKNILSVEPEERVVSPIDEPVVTDLEIKEEEFLLPEEETIHEPKVRPIVGIITESYPGDVAKTKRKKSLHKLESLEPVPWESVPNALVFARKK